MTPRSKRRWIDFAITTAVLTPLALVNIGLALIVAVFGMWSYYDGMTRCDLPDE